LSDRIRVGVIGHGYFGTFHARHYEALDGAELVAIADPRPEAAEAIRAAYGDRHVPTHRDLIGKVDAVSVAVPTSRHAEVAKEMIDAGIHVLVEKPLADSVDEARRLVAEAQERGIVLNVGHIERFSATYQRLKAEWTGEARLIECRRLAPWRGRILDVDVVLDMMIHDLDLILDLVRDRPVEVSASGVEMMGHGFDAMLARIVFAGGIVAHVAASRVAPAIMRTMAITEPRRTLSADLSVGRVGVFTAVPEPTTTEFDVPHHDSLRAEIEAFLASVAGRSGGGVRGEDAVAAMELAEAIRSSAT